MCSQTFSVKGDWEKSERADRGVSLVSQARRDLAKDPQLHLFPERKAYETYLWYCGIVHIISPMSFEEWRIKSREVFGVAGASFGPSA